MTETAVQPGLLLSDWDEAVGPQIVGELLPGITEAAEVLAAQSYMSAQNVFCSAEFSSISFTLPNLKIQRKTKFYFDVVPDPEVRGGQRPFLLAVYLPLNAPDALFIKLDPVIESAVKQYKAGQIPSLEELQAKVHDLMLGKLSTEDIGAEESEIADKIAEETEAETLILKIHCEICKREIPFAISKSSITEDIRPGKPFSEYTYLHGFGEEDIEPHGLKVTVDANYNLTKVEYVDDEGHRISPFQERDLKDLRIRVGPWRPPEVKTLKEQVQKGTPSQTIARMVQRTIKDVDKKIAELEEKNQL